MTRRALTIVAAVAAATVAMLLPPASCRLHAGGVDKSTTPAPVGGLGQACLYWCEVRTQPRPLRIHVLTVDLKADTVGIEAVVAPDPDGNGPAEAGLVTPQALLADQPNLIAAVNANAFRGLPDAKGNRSSDWHAGMRVEIIGWALHAGRTASQPEPHFGNFWIDGDNRAHIALQVDAAKAREAVAGFNILIQDGKTMVGADKVLHPRTAAGTDKAHQRVWLVVVDGRQKGYSEGVTCLELAGIMAGLGCWEAINLDGGGSSVMLRTGLSGELLITNSPCGGLARPIPTMLVIRRK